MLPKPRRAGLRVKTFAVTWTRAGRTGDFDDLPEDSPESHPENTRDPEPAIGKAPVAVLGVEYHIEPVEAESQ